MLNVSSPPPPYRSGAASAQSPAAFVLDASRSQSSGGSPGASGSSRCSSGMISSRMKRRICSRRSRSSSGSVKPANVGGIGGDDTIAAMAEIVTSVADGVATVTLNRPEQRNAMNAALLRGLGAAFDELDGRKDVRVVLVRGEGPAFCSGMDLKEMEAQRGATGDPESGVVRILRRVEASRHPTIAVVHGDAIAGGCELALHCDLRVAADVARFGMPLARIGLVVPFPLAQKLVEIIGPAHTRHLLFTGRLIDARRAHAIGMVHDVVPAADVDRTAAQLARTLADNAPLSLAGIKAVIQRTLVARDAIAHEDLDALALAARRSA